MSIKAEYEIMKLELDNWLFNSLRELNQVAHTKDLILHEVLVDLENLQEAQKKKVNMQQTFIAQGWSNNELAKKLKDIENVIQSGSDLMNRINKILHMSNEFNSGWSSERSIHSFANLPDIKLHWKLKKTLSKPNYFEPNINTHYETDNIGKREWVLTYLDIKVYFYHFKNTLKINLMFYLIKKMLTIILYICFKRKS